MKIFKVRIVSEKGEDSLTIHKTEILVGRSLEADLILNGKGVSRKHASILLKDGKIWIRDLGSKLGIKVNGTELPPESDYQYLEGEMIYFGSLADTVCIEQIDGEVIEERSLESEVLEDEYEFTPSEITAFVLKVRKPKEFSVEPDSKIDGFSEPSRSDDSDKLDKPETPESIVAVENSDDDKSIKVEDKKTKKKSLLQFIFSLLGKTKKNNTSSGNMEKESKAIIAEARGRADLLVEKAEWKAENIIRRAKEKAKKIKKGEATDGDETPKKVE